MTTPTREAMTYKLGKIYQIQPIVEHDEGEIYIGSTCCKYLSQRMKSHRAGYSYWKEWKGFLTSSYNLFEKYGVENCQILLLENVNCENINELKAREAYYIRNLKCVNKYIPLRTTQEYHKEHYNENKDKILEQQKEYRDANLDKEKERSKKYYEKNKATIAEKRRLKRQAKKEAENKVKAF